MTNKILCTVILLACLLPNLGCSSGSKKGAVIASVNGEPVYQSEMVFLERYMRFEQVALISPSYSSADLMNKIVEKKIILQEAKRNNIRLSDAELNTYLRKVSENFFTQKFKESLKERVIDYDEWRSFMFDQALAEKTVEAQLTDLNVEPSEIKKYYYGHLSEFSHSEQVRAYQILVKTKTEIIEVKTRLDRGEDFEKLAKLKSISPESDRGGDLGYFSQDQMPPEISDTVFSISAGKISAPVETAYGFHVFKVTDRKARGTTPLAEAEADIKERIKREKKEIFFKKWIKELAKNADVKLNRELSGVTK